MTQLRPETIEYLKGIGLTLHAGRGKRKLRAAGRARIFLKDGGGIDANDVHMNTALSSEKRPRVRKPKSLFGAPDAKV